MVFLIGSQWLLFFSFIFFLPQLFWAGILLGIRCLRNPRTFTKIAAAASSKQAQGIDFQNILMIVVVVVFVAHRQHVHLPHNNAWYYYLIAFSEHLLQYFSITIISSPTSKQASCVAKPSQVMQLLIFLFTPKLTNGFSDIKNFAIYFHFVRLPTSAINRDAAIIDPAISKNLLLLSFLSVIIPQSNATHKNVMFMRRQNCSFYYVPSRMTRTRDSVGQIV